MTRPDLVVFDLDGTLADSLPAIAASANGVLSELGLPTHPEDRYNHFAGDGAEMLIRRALGSFLPDFESRVPELIQRFRERDEREDRSLSRAYDGVAEALDDLASARVRMAVFSNKEHDEAVSLSERLFGAERFVEIRGHDGRFPLKPDPSGLLDLIALARTTRERTAYVGDTDTDMRTGRNAGVRTIGCLWGFRDRDELLASGADALAASPRDLPSLILP